MEHQVFADKYKVGAVSAVRVLELALEQGKGVYDLDEGNLEEQLAVMDLPEWAENKIRDHVEGGYRAKAPGGVVSQDEWSGVGYVFWKEGGCAAFLLQGDINGGMTTEPFIWGGWNSFWMVECGWQEYYPDVGGEAQTAIACGLCSTRVEWTYPPDSSVWAWGDTIPVARYDTLFWCDEEPEVLGPDTCLFYSGDYPPDLFTLRAEIFGPYPPGSSNDPIWYFGGDSLRFWVFDVRVDREQSTRYLALPEDPGDELPEPARTVFEILPTNFLSGMGARVEEIRHVVRAPDSTTVVYGPVLLDRAQLAASGGHGTVEWDGKKNNGEYVEAEEEDYRTKIALLYEPLAGGRESVNSEPQMGGRDGSSKKALRIDATHIKVTGGSNIGLGNQPDVCAATLPVLLDGHFNDEGRLVMDRMCKGGFEIRKVEGHKRLTIELAAVFDAWPERPLLGEAGLVCEARWEMEGIGDGRVSCPVVSDSEWDRKVEIEKDLDGHREGLHWVDQPAAECFGGRILYLFFDLRHGDKLLAKVPIAAQVAVFFEKGPAVPPDYGSWVDYDSDGVPNWFEYWKDHGCVHPEMGEFQFRVSGWERGGYHQDGDVFLCSAAAVDIPEYQIRNGVGGEVLATFFAKRGIDWCAEVVAHELVHRWVWQNHQPGGQWHGQTDTDGDGLPDDFEVNTTGTNPNLSDTYDLKTQFGTARYGEIGDQEFYCRMQARDTFATDPSKDWANRGKQTDPPW